MCDSFTSARRHGDLCFSDIKNTFDIRPPSLDASRRSVSQRHILRKKGGARPTLAFRRRLVAKRTRCTDHHAKQIPLRDLSLRILIDLHKPLRIRPDGNDHPTRARELLHERRRYRPRRRANVNCIVRPLLRVPCQVGQRPTQ